MFSSPTRKNAVILDCGNDSIFDSINYKVGLQAGESMWLKTPELQCNAGDTDKKVTHKSNLLASNP